MIVGWTNELPFVEQAIDFGSAGEFICVDQCRARTFNCALKIGLKLLNHSVKVTQTQFKNAI